MSSLKIKHPEEAELTLLRLYRQACEQRAGQLENELERKPTLEAFRHGHSALCSAAAALGHAAESMCGQSTQARAELAELSETLLGWAAHFALGSDVAAMEEKRS